VRHILTAELLAVGSELTVGETTDTNSGFIARDLTRRGVEVRQVTALRDDIDAVRPAIQQALARVDLVVLTGGLGPTPDDLTREAVAASVGEAPSVDPDLERWLRGLFERRGAPYPEANIKQAWLIPSATALPNDHGTAPGWWVDRADGRVVIALPGPPREMRPMWQEAVVPRLVERHVGNGGSVVTLRTTGIGESMIADRIHDWLAAHDPEVATYARGEAVDIRIWGPGERVAAAEEAIRAELGSFIWATGETGWADAIAEALTRRGWRLAAVEIGTHGQLAALLGEGLGACLASLEAYPERPRDPSGARTRLQALAVAARERAGAEIGVSVEAVAHRKDTRVSIAVSTPRGSGREHRIVFLSGAQGRGRAAVAAASVVLARLAREPDPPPDR
jgi:nicotinamide-nucleotide amidase